MTSDRPTPAVVQDLASGVKGLLRGQVALAKAELTQNAKDASQHLLKVVLYAVTLMLSGFAFLAFAIAGLGKLLGDNYWLSSGIVFLVMSIPPVLLIRHSMARIQEDASLPQTRESWGDVQELFGGRKP